MTSQLDTKQSGNTNNPRESFSGLLLTNRQYNEFDARVGILHNHIHHKGVFADRLKKTSCDLAVEYKMEVVRAETILRDLFRETYGEYMNQTRERLAKNLEELTDDERGIGYKYAIATGDMMEKGIKITFKRASSHQAQAMGAELGITDVAAYSIMTEQFEAVEGQSFRDWGKELDEQFYRPQIVAEKAEREANQSKTQTKGNGRAKSRGPSRGGPQ
ncbi:MAG: hypothetical protein JJ891_06710 [Rhizobiaceae bacterium]|jgi:hypothetical protein|nr:hypothetical protein [Rhizobiaceae bacterium]